MRLLIRSDNRHEKQLTILEADRSFVRFMETHSHGIVSMHTQASTAWHQKYEEGTVKTSLRAMLWGVLLMEWQARLIEKDTQVLQLAETAGWATRPEWNPEQKKGTAVKPRQPAARGCKASSGAADQLLKNTAKDGTVHRFQSLKPLKPDFQAEVIVVVLTLTVHQHAAEVYRDLDLLANNCAGKLIGLRLRRERVSKSALAN